VKILHTADWHAGRTLLGIDRTPEVREALAEIAGIAEEHEVDLILVAGDLFDSRNPSADAISAVYEFFVRTGRSGIPSVVIAGNHDAPARLDAVREVLGLAGAHVIGRPRVARDGGRFDLRVGDELARIAALPFVSERRLVRLRELLAGDAGQQRESYQTSMRKLILNLTGGFDADAVNLLLLHTTMEGAVLANSEYVFHSTETYTLGPDLIPDSANYTALGHIHKPQEIQGVSGHRARYAGSILQLDFGEQGDRKGVVLIEAGAGRPSEVLETVPLESGRRLRRVRLDERELERRTPELADFDGWLKLAVELDAPRPGLKDRIRGALPNVLAVEQILPELEEEADADLDPKGVSLIEAFSRYYRQEKGLEMDRALEAAFADLHETVLEGSE
jgi:exonuclease SbcD